MQKLKFQRETYGRGGVRYVAGDYTVRAFRSGSRVECWIPMYRGENLPWRGDTLAEGKALCQKHFAANDTTEG